jgi:myosin heavy subunit
VPLCSRYVSRWLLLAFASTVLGCAINHPPASPAEDPQPEVVEALRDDNRRLQQTVADQQRMIDEMEAEVGRLQVQLLEREARCQAIENEMASQQERLDEAVVEVVRTKAKLRSIESRAEAASSITEAEIALKGLKDSLTAADSEPGEEYRKAEALLRMSTSEFRKENYGGALYLAGQAQSQIRGIQNHLAQQNDASLEPGEVRFAQPVLLKVLKRSNLREGPSLEADVLLTLEDDAPVVGYAYKGEWIRVQTEEGARGWIFQALVGRR